MKQMAMRDKNGLTEQEFLAQYSPKDYPRPSVTADILVFHYGLPALKLLLIQRGGHPFLGCWALPGGFVNPDETTLQAAQRELEEETHLKGVVLEELGVFSDPGRDPRAWTMTAAYTAILPSAMTAQAGDDARDAEWFDVNACWQGEEAHTQAADGKQVLTRVLSLALCSPKETLKAKLRFICTKDAFSSCVQWEILENDGLAFDHAKIIASALCTRPLLAQYIATKE